MKSKNKLFWISLIFFFVVFVKDAYAYLDPGTGSYFLQLFIAGLLGSLFFIKTFWRGILRIVRGLFLKLFKPVKKD